MILCGHTTTRHGFSLTFFLYSLQTTDIFFFRPPTTFILWNIALNHAGLCRWIRCIDSGKVQTKLYGNCIDLSNQTSCSVTGPIARAMKYDPINYYIIGQWQFCSNRSQMLHLAPTELNLWYCGGVEIGTLFCFHFSWSEFVRRLVFNIVVVIKTTNTPVNIFKGERNYTVDDSRLDES